MCCESIVSLFKFNVMTPVVFTYCKLAILYVLISAEEEKLRFFSAVTFVP